jgi:hypothetical protein
MTDLSPETRGLLDSLAGSHDPPPEAAARVRERVAARAAAAPPRPPLASWPALVGLGLAALAVGWFATRPAPAPRPAPPPVTVARPAPAPAVVAGPAATAPVPTVAPAPAPAAVPAAPRVERDDLPAELRLIERAQTALAAGDTAAARAALRGHARAFPHGHLVEEREALSTLVLCEGGPSVEASRAAAAFLARHPDSPQAARVRRACASSR